MAVMMVAKWVGKRVDGLAWQRVELTAVELADSSVAWKAAQKVDL